MFQRWTLILSAQASAEVLPCLTLLLPLLLLAAAAAWEISWLQPGKDTSCGLREPHSVVSKLCFPLRIAASSTGGRDADAALHFALRVVGQSDNLEASGGAFARSQLDVWMWQADTS